jgi:parallel beta-helix repeat protein
MKHIGIARILITIMLISIVLSSVSVLTASRISLSLQNYGKIGYKTIYIVFGEGSMYYAKDTTDGSILSNGTSASTVINNAIGNLTAGRTWQQTVYLEGNFTIFNPIIVPSYTHIIINGTIYANANLNNPIIMNLNGFTADTFITIEGGNLYGNSAGQTSGECDAIYFANATDSQIKNVCITDTYYNGISFVYGCNRSTIVNCRFEDCSMTPTNGGIYISNSANVQILDCYFNSSGQHAIYWNHGSPYGLIEGCTITNCNRISAGSDISVRSNNTIISHCYISQPLGTEAAIEDTIQDMPCNVTVSDCDIYGMQYGIYVHGDYWTIEGCSITGIVKQGIALVSSSHNVITGNNISYCQDNGVELRNGASYIMISNNMIIANHWGVDASDSGVGCKYNTVSGNTFVNTTSYSIDMYDLCDYWNITGNTFEPGGQLTMNLIGNHTQVHNNSGYNPVGYEASPVTGSNLVDYGSGTIANNTLYTCVYSPKDLYITSGAFNGVTYNCTVNGQVIFSNATTGPTMVIHLEPGMTILFGWSSAPTITVYGN